MAQVTKRQLENKVDQLNSDVNRIAYERDAALEELENDKRLLTNAYKALTLLTELIENTVRNSEIMLDLNNLTHELEAD